MRAVILAAGRGRRMKELGDQIPKGLIKLGDKPLLEYQLFALRQAGISEIALVTGYRDDLFEHYDLVKFHNGLWENTNMVTSLNCATDWLKAEPCIVSYSDIFYEISAVTSLLENKDELALTYDPDWLKLWTQRFRNPLIDAETFRLGSNHRLLEIGKKPTSTDEIEGQYMGLLRLTPKAWAEILRLRTGLSSVERDKIDMTGILQFVLEAGRISITALPYFGHWGEVDSVDDLQLYESFLASN